MRMYDFLYINDISTMLINVGLRGGWIRFIIYMKNEKA